MVINNLEFWVLVGGISGFLGKLTTEIGFGNGKYSMKSQFVPQRWLVLSAFALLIIMFTTWTFIMVNIYHLPIYLTIVGSYLVMHGVFLRELRHLNFLPNNKWLKEIMRWSFFSMQISAIIFPTSWMFVPMRCGNALAGLVFWAIPQGMGIGIIVGFSVAVCVCLSKYCFYKITQKRDF